MNYGRIAGVWVTLGMLGALLAGCDRRVFADKPSPVVQADKKPVENAVVTSRDDYAATLQPGQVITVDNPYGDVHARFGGFANAVETHTVLQEPKGAAHIELKPQTTADGLYTIAPRLPAGATITDSQRIDMSVLVPDGHALRVSTEQGLIDVHGIHGDVDLKSAGGNLNLRGIQGAIQGETTAGSIEASLGTAPKGAQQRLATTTGDIEIGVDDQLDAAIDLATSALFATDYSLTVTRNPGQEPNKHARALVGRNASRLTLESLRGEIRLRRRAGFTSVGGAPDAGQQGEDDNDSD
jgi:hypothetical protein